MIAPLIAHFCDEWGIRFTNVAIPGSSGNILKSFAQRSEARAQIF